MSIQDVATMLANAHREEDPDLQAIYWVPHETEVLLVEVSRAVGTTHKVMPFRFAPTSDVEYPSVVVLLSPEEFEELREGGLRLPDSWGADPTNRWQSI